MNWYLIYTRSNHEKKVKKLLEQKNFETFLPLIECLDLANARNAKINIPPFSSYLFARTEMNVETYLKIVRIPGVVGFYSIGKKPAVVPDGYLLCF